MDPPDHNAERPSFVPVHSSFLKKAVCKNHIRDSVCFSQRTHEFLNSANGQPNATLTALPKKNKRLVQRASSAAGLNKQAACNVAQRRHPNRIGL